MAPASAPTRWPPPSGPSNARPSPPFPTASRGSSAASVRDQTGSYPAERRRRPCGAGRDVRPRFAELDGDVDVDCSGLHFIDASGLGVLAAARTACDDRGAKLVLVDPSPFLRRLLQLTDLDTVFHVRATPSAS